jgi:MoxR-like ATPase
MSNTARATAPSLTDKIHHEVSRVIEGQEHIVQHVLTALVAGGHALLEGVPGVAKTLMVRSVSAALAVSFSRIQFTPDLMPADILGVNVFDMKTSDFRFRPGPLFADMVLADEINRAPAKTQAALLEAMQERQISTDGETRPLSPLFTVIATQNPVEYEGTYPLPEAQLDRFLMKILVEYPSAEAEKTMLLKMHRLGEHALNPSQVVQAVANAEELLHLRQTAHGVEVDQTVVEYIVSIIRQSRTLPSLSLGASPRAGVMLLQVAKAFATLHGRTYVTPDDIRELVFPVLRHRLRLTPEAEIEGLTPDTCLASLLQHVAVPR